MVTISLDYTGERVTKKGIGPFYTGYFSQGLYQEGALYNNVCGIQEQVRIDGP